MFRLEGISRRNFIKGIAAGVVIAASPIGIVNKAFADYTLDDVPPGIRISYKIDPQTFQAWLVLKKYDNPIRAMSMLRLDENVFNSNIIVTNNFKVKEITPSLDPGYHVTAALTWADLVHSGGRRKRLGANANLNHRSLISELSNKNMQHFGNGFVQYTNQWILEEKINKKEYIEKQFLSAMFGSAGINNIKSQTEIQNLLKKAGYNKDFKINIDNCEVLSQSYMNLPNNKFKKIILDYTIKSLKQLDKKSTEALIAAWSSFWLTRNAEQQNNCIGFRDEKENDIKTDAGMYAWNLELKMVYDVGIRIRNDGPAIYEPNYF